MKESIARIRAIMIQSPEDAMYAIREAAALSDRAFRYMFPAMQMQDNENRRQADVQKHRDAMAIVAEAEKISEVVEAVHGTEKEEVTQDAQKETDAARAALMASAFEPADNIEEPTDNAVEAPVEEATVESVITDVEQKDVYTSKKDKRGIERYRKNGILINKDLIPVDAIVKVLD